MSAPVVKPRSVWVGTLAMLLGFVVGGLGVVLTSWWLSAAGAAAFLVGALLGWRGGIMYDVHGGGTPGAELQDVIEGETRRGEQPGEIRDDAEARASARSATQAKRARLAAAQGVPAPWRPAAATVMLFLAAWLLFGQFLLSYPATEIGQDAQQRHSGLSIVLALSALFLRHKGPSRVASGLALACGAALILSALFLPHDSIKSLLTEWSVGVLVLVAGAASLRG